MAAFLDQVEVQSLKAHGLRAALQRDIDALERQLREVGGAGFGSAAGAVRVVLEAAQGEKQGATRTFSLKLTYCACGCAPDARLWAMLTALRLSACSHPRRKLAAIVRRPVECSLLF